MIPESAHREVQRVLAEAARRILDERDGDTLRAFDATDADESDCSHYCFSVPACSRRVVLSVQAGALSFGERTRGEEGVMLGSLSAPSRELNERLARAEEALREIERARIDARNGSQALEVFEARVRHVVQGYWGRA